MFETYLTQLQVLSTVRKGPSKVPEDGGNISHRPTIWMVSLDGGGCLRGGVVR